MDIKQDVQLPKNSSGEVVLDIGSGKKPHPQASITMDSEVSANPTFCNDLGDKWPIPDSTVDKIYARAVLEHLPHSKNITVFREVERVLKHGGEFSFNVPHYYSVVAADDPTHNSFWTIKTLEYFCGNRMTHVFKKTNLEIVRNQVIVELPTPLTFIWWPRYRVKIKGGARLEQIIKLPFILGQVSCTVRRV